MLTSTGVSEVSASQEPQITGSCPDCLGVSEAELGVKVVSMQRLFPINCVVACGVVRTAHPNLSHR